MIESTIKKKPKYFMLTTPVLRLTHWDLDLLTNLFVILKGFKDTLRNVFRTLDKCNYCTNILCESEMHTFCFWYIAVVSNFKSVEYPILSIQQWTIYF